MYSPISLAELVNGSDISITPDGVIFKNILVFYLPNTMYLVPECRDTYLITSDNAADVCLPPDQIVYKRFTPDLSQVKSNEFVNVNRMRS